MPGVVCATVASFLPENNLMGYGIRAITDGVKIVRTSKYIKYINGLPTQLRFVPYSMYGRGPVIEEIFFESPAKNLFDRVQVGVRQGGYLQYEGCCNAQNVLGRSDDCPSLVEYAPAGHRHKIYYYQNGIIHRNRGPAVITLYPNGKKMVAEWYIQGQRQGVPVRYDAEGKRIEPIVPVRRRA